MRPPRVLIAGTSGGCGKTLVAVGLQAAWRGRGLRVAPFKKGPDFIDAAWSSSAAGRPCRNLDLFILSPAVCLSSFVASSSDADVAVIEGNRGLHDGADAGGSCSTAELAKILKCPVVLVVDCTKATRTVAAIVLGCQRLDPDVPIRGVVLNNTAGPRHESIIRDAVRAATGLPVLGVLPRLPGEMLPERHMGLVPPEEHSGRDGAVREAGEIAARFLDLEAILGLAGRAPPLDLPAGGDGAQDAPEPAGRVGLFRDAAFQFYYPENLEALVRAGASLVEVSPLHDRGLPELDALYIGGGFPETQASTLADNEPFRASVRRAIEAGLPVYAECGGAVFLGEKLCFRGGEYPMASALPVAFEFQERPRGHGYTVLETVSENAFFPIGAEIRGHEFHHTYVRPESIGDLKFAFRMRRGYGFDGTRDGLCRRNVLASYTHVHALGVEDWAPSLVRRAVRFRTRSSRSEVVHP